MALVQMIAERGGVVRASEVIRAGYARRQVVAELESGGLERPLRGWVALPTADRDLLFAARHHAVLSCVTQARRIHLWVPQPPRELHISVSPHANVQGRGCHVHWHRPWITRPPFALEDPLENVLQAVADCQPYEAALSIWESALNSRATDVARLRSLPLSARTRQLLSACTPFSDSGLESLVVSRLRWLPARIFQQTYLHGHRVDVLIGARLVVQLDGSTHTGEQRDADNLHDAQLRQRGYTVIRVSYRQVMHAWESAQELVLAAMARGAHLA